jgi:hypothetical protein
MDLVYADATSKRGFFLIFEVSILDEILAVKELETF